MPETLHVLLVSYVFPPAGGVGALRAASLARHLPAEDIRLDVVTTRNPSAVGADPTLLEGISDAVTVHRTLTIDVPFRVKKWMKRVITGNKQSASNAKKAAGTGEPSFRKRLIQDLLLPDPQVTWVPVLKRAARRIIRKRKIDVVLITVPPFSALLLVEHLRKRFPQLSIVVDFRDEWLSTAIDLVGFSRSERARSLARDTEAAAVNNASAVVAVTNAAQREIRGRYPQLPGDKFHLIPNGFDAARLRSAMPESMPPAESKIVISHIGTVYASTEPSTLVAAFQSLPPGIKLRFRFRFIGHIEEQRFRDSLLQLGDAVELRGFLPQREALSAMYEADYVLLVQHGPLNVAAKFFDYIGGGKPVLATVHPKSDERVLLEELRAGWWAPDRDVDAIRQLLLDTAARGKAPFSDFKPDRAKIAQYERKVLAQRYAALLHSVADTAREKQSQEQETLAGGRKS